MTSPCRKLRRRQRAFTLAEMMTAMTLFSLVVIAVIYSHLFGLRMFNITAAKIGASQAARAAMNQVRDDIRSGKLIYVGSGNGESFTNVALSDPRQGNALQIYPQAGGTNFVRYYLDPASQTLKRVASDGTNIQTIASFITNQVVFCAEDCAGNILTNDQNNRIIRMTLEFYQWEFPIAQVGAYYDYFRVQTRMARRAIE